LGTAIAHINALANHIKHPRATRPGTAGASAARAMSNRIPVASRAEALRVPSDPAVTKKHDEGITSQVFKFADNAIKNVRQAATEYADDLLAAVQPGAIAGRVAGAASALVGARAARRGEQNLLLGDNLKNVA